MATATRKIKAEPATEWYGWLETPSKLTDSGVVHDADHNRRSLVNVRGETIGELFADIYREATYYHSLGYRVFTSEIHRECVACGGSGVRAVKITKSCPAGERKCKACRGVGIFETIGSIYLEHSTNVEIKMV